MPQDTATDTATLLLACPDQPGIVAAVADFVHRHGGNIVSAEQHTDRLATMFYQRVEFELGALDLATDEIEPAFASIRDTFDIAVDLRFSARAQRVAILCSKQGHCVHDLLSRWRLGELPGEASMVISNHETHRDIAEQSGVGFHHLPVTPDTRASQEAAMLDLLGAGEIDLVIMARYMQILSDRVIGAYPAGIINIHHSFLPAFPGGRPYHQAFDRGVKIIGATAHYATAALDEGPIIEQDVVRVTHRDTPDDLVRHGRDVERVVLARAVRAHLEHRVIVSGNKTVVFG